MNLAQAVLLGIVEGTTEFIPVSSTGHLLITEHLLGLPMKTQQQKDSLIGFTAVIQTGAILAAVIYFLRDIIGIVLGFFGGLFDKEKRAGGDFHFALAVVVGSVPIAIVGFALRDVIKSMDTQLVAIGLGLLVFSPVFVIAERRATQARFERSLTLPDALLIGGAQCFALVPGVSRSGATISAGLLRGLDRVSATRLSFLLGIPALLGAGLLGLKDATSNQSGALATAVATGVAFVVAYASIWFLLRLVAKNPITIFVPYRIGLGIAVLAWVAFSG